MARENIVNLPSDARTLCIKRFILHNISSVISSIYLIYNANAAEGALAQVVLRVRLARLVCCVTGGEQEEEEEEEEDDDDEDEDVAWQGVEEGRGWGGKFGNAGSIVGT
jgi:hypothetical protein